VANYSLVQPDGVSAYFTRANLAITGLSANDRVYDATIIATLAGSATVTALATDQISLAGSATAAFATKNVGDNIAVTVSGVTLAGTDAGNYTLVQPAGLSADITRANLAITGLSANDRVYDATTIATLAGSATVNAMATDQVSVAGSAAAAFADKNVGDNVAVTVFGLTLSGVDAGNYTLTQPAGLNADITRASLTVTGLSANDRAYDATTIATLAGTASVAALAADQISLAGSGSAAFANKNVGSNIAVTVSGYSLSGTDAANYTLVQPASLSADITRANLAITGLSANDRVYDATTIATLTGAATVAALATDQVSIAGSASAAFAAKNAGDNIAVTVSGLTLSGVDAGNYALTQPAGLNADITRANLAITGLSANDRVYDATTIATLTGAATVAALATDQVSIAGSASAVFASKNVGIDIPITVSGYTLGGVDAGNYAVVQPMNLVADITAAGVVAIPAPLFEAPSLALPLCVPRLVHDLDRPACPRLQEDAFLLPTNAFAVQETPLFETSRPSLTIVNGGVRLQDNADE
jgi:trimeric autotransporter adhesin